MMPMKVHVKGSAVSPVFRRFLISYLLVLVLPLIAGFASYWTSIQAAEASSINNSLNTLKLSKAALEQRLRRSKPSPSRWQSIKT